MAKTDKLDVLRTLDVIMLGHHIQGVLREGAYRLEEELTHRDETPDLVRRIVAGTLLNMTDSLEERMAPFCKDCAGRETDTNVTTAEEIAARMAELNAEEDEYQASLAYAYRSLRIFVRDYMQSTDLYRAGKDDPPWYQIEQQLQVLEKLDPAKKWREQTVLRETARQAYANLLSMLRQNNHMRCRLNEDTPGMYRLRTRCKRVAETDRLYLTAPNYD